MQTGQNARNAGNGFNTLAQLRTTPNLPLKGKEIVVVKGKGTELKNTKAIKGRAKRKMITQKRTLKLIDVAKRKGETETLKQYWNTFYCQSKLITTNGRQHADTCKNRFCVLCCSIREAVLINKYSPVVNKWPDPYFVGLTIKAVSAKKLKFYIDAMYKAFRLIIQKYQKRHKRGKGKKLIGFKTLECEFNDEKLTYNPHFNVVVPDKETGETIRAEWCKIWTRRFVNPEIQYCEPVRSRKKVMKEVIKYCTKTFSEPDKSKKLKRMANPKIYVAAFHNVITAMRGHRIFERFGFNLPKSDTNKPEGGIITKVAHYIKWKYSLKYFDWVGEDTDGLLTNYSPDTRIVHLMDNCMDLLLE